MQIRTERIPILFWLNIFLSHLPFYRSPCANFLSVILIIARYIAQAAGLFNVILCFENTCKRIFLKLNYHIAIKQSPLLYSDIRSTY